MALTLSMAAAPLACSERDLVAAARAGDDRAFGELYALYQGRISGFIFSKVRDHGRAEDITQEVFISALRRLRSSDQQVAFKPWIYEIAKNACIDEFRRGTRSREVPLEIDEESYGSHRGLLSVAPTPPAAIESKQRLDDLKGAFGGLSDSHHKMLVMREFEGLSYDEIGDRLGMTRQMVESGLFRARRKLTDEYAELASGRRCEQVQNAIDAGPARSLRSLGVRERRRFSRHLSHCQTCRHTARLAGVDEALFQAPSIAKKIAALLPFPLWRWRWPWRSGRGRGGAAPRAGAGSHHFAAVQSLHNAARVAEPASSTVTIGQAAAAAAALAIAGAGGGLVGGLTAHRHPSRPATAVLAAARTKPSQPVAKRALVAPAAVAPVEPVILPAPPARQSSHRGQSSSHVTGISRVSAVRSAPRSTRPVAAGPKTAAAGVPKPGSSANPPAAAPPARADTGGALPAKLTPPGVPGSIHSTVSGVVKSTASGAGHVISGAGHVISTATRAALPAAPASSSAPTVQSTIDSVLSSGSTSTSSGATGATETLKKTVSDLLSQ